MNSSFERTIETPPGWWWRQRAAARIEAERQCPIDLETASIELRRNGRWRPDAPGVFTAVYGRRWRKEEPTEAKAVAEWRHPLAGAALLGAALAFALAVAFPISARWRDIYASPTTRPGSGAEMSVDRIAAMTTVLADLDSLAKATPPQSSVVSVVWTPSQVTVVGGGIEVGQLQAALQSRGRTLRIVAATGSTDGHAAGSRRPGDAP